MKFESGEIVNLNAISNVYEYNLQTLKEYAKTISEELEVLEKSNDANKRDIFLTQKKLEETERVIGVFEKIINMFDSLREELLDEFIERKYYDEELYNKL